MPRTQVETTTTAGGGPGAVSILVAKSKAKAQQKGSMMVHFNKNDTVFNVDPLNSVNKPQTGKRVRYRQDDGQDAATGKPKSPLGASKRASFKKLASERIPWKSGFESIDFGGSAEV